MTGRMTWRRAGLYLLIGLAMPCFVLGQSRPESTAVVSADLLRHPLPDKARQMLQRALEFMNSGDHHAAIALLREVLAKFPESAAHTQSILGVEYLKTDRFSEAVASFEEAVRLLPHDAVNRYNLALALACSGDYQRSEVEARRALEMDPHNSNAKTLLNALAPGPIAHK